MDRGIGESIYLFLMYLVPVLIGMTTVSASAYGLGKHEKNKDSDEYKVSLVFFVIGIVASTVSVMLWQQGNYMTSQCEYLIKDRGANVATLVDITKRAVDDNQAIKIKSIKGEVEQTMKQIAELTGMEVADPAATVVA